MGLRFAVVTFGLALLDHGHLTEIAGSAAFDLFKIEECIRRVRDSLSYPQTQNRGVQIKLKKDWVSSKFHVYPAFSTHRKTIVCQLNMVDTARFKMAPA